MVCCDESWYFVSQQSLEHSTHLDTAATLAPRLRPETTLPTTHRRRRRLQQLALVLVLALALALDLRRFLLSVSKEVNISW